MTARARVGVTALLVAVVSLASSRAADAQDFGLRGGPSVDPFQLYGGVQYAFPAVWETLRPTPSLDFGVAHDAPLCAVNLDALLTSRKVGPNNEWTVFVGGGPSIHKYRNTIDPTRVGMNAVAALGHDSGWFGEFRLGFFDSVRARFSVGYRLGARQAASKGRP